MNKIIYYLSFSALITLYACNAFIEPALNDAEVQLISPPDNIESQNYVQTFWWEKVDGASRYNIQIVSPGFDSVATLVADTNITSNKFTVSLSPGSYQWRVRAENSGTVSPYSMRSFTVDTAGLASQQVVITTPPNATFFGAKILLDWQPLFGASQYQVQIDTSLGAFAEEFLIENERINVPTSNFFKNFGRTTGSFIWRLRAMNAQDTTSFTPPSNFVINNTPPVITAPVNTSPSNVTLRWDPLPGATLYDVHIKKQTNGSRTVFTGFPKQISTTSHNFTAIVGDTIWWTVGARDVAGNISDTTTSQKVIISSQ